MSLVIPPGFGSAAFIFGSTEGTPPFVTTLGVDLSDAGGDFVSAANLLMFNFAQNWAGLIDSSLTLVSVSLAVGQDGPGGSVDSDLPPIAMTRSGNSAPVAMAPILRKVTNQIGRRGRGRMFIPGAVAQTDTFETGALTPARVTALNAAATAWYEDLTTDPVGSYPPVLLHSSAPTDPTPVTGFQVSPLVGWIRGRIR